MLYKFILCQVKNISKCGGEESKNDDEESENNLPILVSNLSLTRDEALFLQCNSESDKIKKKCFDMFKINDELASEILNLKNIKSLKDCVG